MGSATDATKRVTVDCAAPKGRADAARNRERILTAPPRGVRRPRGGRLPR